MAIMAIVAIIGHYWLFMAIFQIPPLFCFSFVLILYLSALSKGPLKWSISGKFLPCKVHAWDAADCSA